MSFIIFTDMADEKIALRHQDILKVSSMDDLHKCTTLEYSLGRKKKVQFIRVKHTIQEVIDSLNKMNNIF